MYFGSFFSRHKLRQEVLKPMEKWGKKKQKQSVSNFWTIYKYLGYVILAIGQTIYMDQTF